MSFRLSSVTPAIADTAPISSGGAIKRGPVKTGFNQAPLPIATPEGKQFEILRVIWAERTPLTRRQLRLKTGFSEEDISEGIAGLRAGGYVLALNTVIESYVASASALETGIPLPLLDS